jgi:hypothetical protein
VAAVRGAARHPDARVRAAAAALVSFIVESREVVAPRLRALLLVERDPIARASFVLPVLWKNSIERDGGDLSGSWHTRPIDWSRARKVDRRYDAAP